MESGEQLKQEMLKGWNTWYNNNVLTHVLLPEGIAVSLAFKFYNTGQVLRESLIGRHLGASNPWEGSVEDIHPGPRSYNGSYTELKLSCADHEIIVQSAAVDNIQYLLITPVKNGIKPATLLVSAAVLWNKPGYTRVEDGHLKACAPGREIEIFIDGKQVRQMNTGLTNPYIAVELRDPVAVSTGKNIDAPELKLLLEKQKTALLDENKKYGSLAEAYNAMRSCLAWASIYEPEKDRICSPVSRIWNVNWGGYVLFGWDTYFSSMMTMLGDKNLAYSNAIAIAQEKTESGFIPNFGSADDKKSRDRSEPPVGSLAVRELYRAFREKWIVEYLYDDLLSWNRWYADNRMLSNGQLCLGSDPIQPRTGFRWETDGVHDRFGAALESGMDNSAMYDNIPFDKKTNMLCLADVGVTGLYIMDCEKLAELAELIGRGEAPELRSRAELSKKGLEELWDEEYGFYLNKRTDTGDFSRSISATNFYALFSDKVSAEHAQRMMKEHFFNPEEYYGDYMIPNTGRNDPAFRDQDYWRGRIWGPSNYLAYIAMRTHGLNEPCKILAEKGLAMLMKEWLAKGHVHENYNGETGEGCDARNSNKFYNWGGLLSLIALIEAGHLPGPEEAL
jgi:hypothetical protein